MRPTSKPLMLSAFLFCFALTACASVASYNSFPERAISASNMCASQPGEFAAQATVTKAGWSEAVGMCGVQVKAYSAGDHAGEAIFKALAPSSMRGQPFYACLLYRSQEPVEATTLGRGVLPSHATSDTVVKLPASPASESRVCVKGSVDTEGGTLTTLLTVGPFGTPKDTAVMRSFFTASPPPGYVVMEAAAH